MNTYLAIVPSTTTPEPTTPQPTTTLGSIQTPATGNHPSVGRLNLFQGYGESVKINVKPTVLLLMIVLDYIHNNISVIFAGAGVGAIALLTIASVVAIIMIKKKKRTHRSKYKYSQSGNSISN